MYDADAIVIGSGAGGLAAAVVLAQQGERVIVCEQHRVAGGLCHSFYRGRHRFSPGVHYLGQLGPGGFLRSLYEGLGVGDDLVFFEMNRAGYEHLRLGDLCFDIPSGREAVVEALSARFGREAQGIARYFWLVDRIGQELQVIPETKTALEFLTVPYRTRHMGRYGVFSLDTVLCELVSDPTLRALLSFQCGDHGLPPAKVPFALHAAVAGHYLDGGYYPKGGGEAIVAAMVQELQRAGGTLLTSCDVAAILIEAPHAKRRAIGVRLKDGRTLRAKRVISNAAPQVTYLDLVGAEHLSWRLRRKLSRTVPSIASLSLFLATDLDLVGLGLDSGNYWYAPHHDFVDAFARLRFADLLTDAEHFGLFLGVTSLKDPQSQVGRTHTIEAVTFVSPYAFARLTAQGLKHGSAQYRELKQRLTDGMLTHVERLIPGIRRHLLYCELATPLTTEHYVRAPFGGCYGTQKNLGQIGPFSFQPKSEIDGLGLCGASIIGHGVAGATMSGINTVAELLACKPSSLLRHTGQSLRVFPADDARAWPDWLARGHAHEPEVATA